MEEEGKRKRIRESWKTESGSRWRRRKMGWGGEGGGANYWRRRCKKNLIKRTKKGGRSDGKKRNESIKR